MARPKQLELTQRELEVMHVFWRRGELTAADARNGLAKTGRDLAYTTVATLVRILAEKGFLAQTNQQRPFRYRPARTFHQTARSLLGDLLGRVFRGSREQLLLQLFGQRKPTRQERAVLKAILRGPKR